ncbi:class I tRNA ligase family protein [bacterium]|nr:class I tRNA ligase family protein [bacterium]
MNNRNKTIYITTPIYYVNDKPHIGHAYTTIVADVLARYYRNKLGDDNVYFLTGTDEHGAKIAESAAKVGIDPQKFTDQISDEFKEAWQNLEISNDQFIRTTSEKHIKIVTDILNKLKEAKTPLGNDVLYESEYEGLYCVGCEKFLNPSDLVDEKCPDHNQKPKLVKEKNWFFRLNDFLPLIKEKITKDELLIYPSTRKNEVLGLIDKQDLPDFSISRSIKSVPWGIDLPWDKNQKSYVWVDALSNYITALDYPQGDLFQKFWPANIQLLALDILKFHTLYWPAILLALGMELPKQLAIHGFFTINGQKMSKTIGNVIHPNEVVEKYGAEVSKYLILSQFSFGSESDIKVEDFPIKYNADLVNGLGNLINRTTKMVEDYLDGEIDKSGLEIIEDVVSKINQDIEKINFKEALVKIWKLIQESNFLIDQEKPWELSKSNNKDDQEKLKSVLGFCIKNLYNVAYSLNFLMPQKSQEILDIIQADKIKKPAKPLFPRL